MIHRILIPAVLLCFFFSAPVFAQLVPAFPSGHPDAEEIAETEEALAEKLEDLADLAEEDEMLPAGLHEHRLVTKDGLERLYYVFIPPEMPRESPGTVQREKFPVVIVLHGGGGNALQVRRHVEMDALAAARRFITVYPEGTGKKIMRQKFATWNGGFCCGEAQENNIDDAGFIAAMLDELEENYPVDSARIYATGISNGGLMAQVLACRLSGRIAAVSSIAGPGVPEECNPARPVPMMIIHGTEDRCTPYEGGEKCGGCWQEVMAEVTPFEPKRDAHFPCMGAETQEGFWRMANGCPAEHTVTFKSGDTMCRQSLSCRNDSHVALCTVYEGGHTWPGAAEAHCLPVQKLCQARRNVMGRTSRDFNANEMMWRFFSTHRLPRD